MNIPSFVISLPNKDEEYSRSQEQLEKAGFTNVHRFDAVIGKNLNPYIGKDGYNNNNIPVTINAMKDIRDGRVRHSGISSLGAIGCSMSHYMLWNKLLETSYDYFYIFEDDLKIVDYEKLENLINSKIDCDILLLGYINVFSEPIEIKNEIKTHEGYFWGTQAYRVSRRGAHELVRNFFPIDVQIDNYIAEMAIAKKIIIKYQDNFVQQLLHLSSIQTNCVVCELDKKYNNYKIAHLGSVILFSGLSLFFL